MRNIEREHPWINKGNINKVEHLLSGFDFKMEVRDGIFQDLLYLITNGGTISNSDIQSIKKRWEETK